ncbi:MAG: aldehyde dehydrogenase family protein [Lentisphaeria bacterium]|nr:aldehyde dehydrogenase family protein [Lentisphaeria bacterium]
MASEIHLKNPFTGELLQRYPLENFETIQHKLAQARKAQNSWKSLSLDTRISALEDALSYFEENRELLGREISEQMGRPLSQASGEVDGMLVRARHQISIAKESLARDEFTDQNGFIREMEHKPLGVILIISAWNYPLLIGINGVITALLAGNTVLMKNARYTLSIGDHFKNAFGKLAGIEHLLQAIVIDHATTKQTIEETDIDHVVFTGSVDAGRIIYHSVAERLIDCTLELGGKDAAYVAEDADIAQAAETVVDGAFFNAGQCCCGIERVYVHQSVAADFIAQCKRLAEAYVLGDPADAKTTMGPLAGGESAAALLTGQVDDALAKGAHILCGGKGLQIGNGQFFEATILESVSHEMTVMHEENFGPILPVMIVADDAEAIGLINDSEFGLTTAIFTSSTTRVREFSDGVEAGTVFMNRCDYLDPALAWSGVKHSGVGCSLSRYGFYALSRTQSNHFKLPSG